MQFAFRYGHQQNNTPVHSGPTLTVLTSVDIKDTLSLGRQSLKKKKKAVSACAYICLQMTFLRVEKHFLVGKAQGYGVLVSEVEMPGMLWSLQWGGRQRRVS